MDKAVSAFLDLLAVALLTAGVPVVVTGGYRSMPAWIAILLAIVCFFAGKFWERLKPALGPELVGSVGKVAADFRIWLGIVLLLWLYLAGTTIVSVCREL
jgi:hypothetical protein